MNFSPNSILVASAFIPWVVASAIPRSPDKFDWSSKKALLAFGDSYTYVQGTHGHQNYSFIGDSFNFSYNEETLLSDMIVQNQTGTAEGGPNWVEYLTGCGEKPGLTSPRSCEKQLWDFAFAGADISTEYTPLHHNFTVPIVDQIKQYATYGHTTLSKFLRTSETLVAVWIGINDVGDSAKYAVDFPTFYANLTNTLFNSVDTLYDLGYRSYLIMNLPPMDRDPSNVDSSYPTPNVTQVAWYNAALAQRAEKFGDEKRDVEIRVFDAHARLSWILDHPSEFGIVNTTSYCAGYDQPDIAWNYRAYGCPTPLDEYFWYNTGHMTSHTHRLLASELEEWLES
ncbi:uncharacterized protein N7503_001141 [Penicillium pulvis]|uniref:uncharacterized protein n=1 Tax=Penicillium pulvis TaxID=1562058 RepID=UPI002549332E|nr:uncharacterized protein N7503_001141 [Penicillium pulvis]KAJ5814391.1 hypothetical protein N7503_001141 [Penicillium pulvis]